MPRWRCLTAHKLPNRRLPATISAIVFCVALSAHSTHAQQTPAPQPPSAPAPAVTPQAPPVQVAAPPKPAPAPPPERLKVRLRLGDGLHTWRPSRRQIGVSYAPGGNDTSEPGQFAFVVDRAALRRYLNAIAPYIRRHPRNAHIVLTGSGSDYDEGTAVPAEVDPGWDGASLDVDAAVDLIQKTIQATPATVHIVLPIKSRPASITAADLKGINGRIGYFVTHFDPGNVGRTLTVRRAIDLINGHIVPPGAIFSVNQTVGERTPKHGFYGKSDVFINGHMEIQSGGGMCQVATTLFNAAMLADLKIVERHQHMRTIPYAAPGRDATVYWGEKDFKFQNDTDAPVYIDYFTTRSHAICSIFGKRVPGRHVVLVSHYRQLGERHFTGVFYRLVKERDGTVHKDPTFYSAYKWTPALDYNR